ncbi:MAG: F0F1 ATP synthase subunit epsilon [SAR202 cluster bacterium]|nr:F0F1 ATP synthase subunit epsilon [SAR202 cluster bacterium]
MATIKLEIVTAEKLVYSDSVNVLVAPGVEGELAIMPKHAPLLTMLKPGEIRLIKEGKETYMAITGGFLEVIGDKIVILADAVERADEIDAARAQEALKKAQESIAHAGSDADLEKALAAIRRSQIRLKVAQRRSRSDRGDNSRPGSA